MSDIKILTIKYDMCAKHIQFTYDLAQELSHKKEISSTEKRRFMARYNDLEKYRIQLDEVYVAILSSKQLKEDKREEIEKSYETVTDMFYSIQAVYSTYFDVEPSAASATTTSATTKANDVEFHLPKINLTRFSGSHIDWPNFISIFNSVVHENQRLTPVQKLHYLLGVLDKEPLSLVKHLIISSANYSVAYDILTERYENKRLIADKYVEAILNLPNLSQVNFKTLNKFISTIKENIQALMALQFDVNSWSFLLLHIILRKLNIDLRTKFEARIDTHGIPSFKQLTMFLETHLRILENVASSTFQTAPKSVNVVNLASKPHSYSCNCCGE